MTHAPGRLGPDLPWGRVRRTIAGLALVVLASGCGTATTDAASTIPAAASAPPATRGPTAPADERFVGPDDIGVPFQVGLGCFAGAFDPIPGDVIVVAPDGDGDGTDAAPTSLAVGLCSAVAGQTVELTPGTYRTSVVLGAFENDGVVTVRGGESVVLDGEGQRSMGIGLVESSGYRIEGIEFRNYLDAGLYALLGSNLAVSGNRFVDNGRGSIDPDAVGEGFGVNVVGTENVVIAGNEAVGNGPDDDRMARGILGTGINTYEVVNGVISGNSAHDNRGGGILVEEGVNVLIEGNLISANTLDAAGEWWDGGIWVDGGLDVVVRGNTVTGNAGPGIQLSDEEGAYPERSIGYVVEGNTVTGNLHGLYVWGWGSCPDPPADAVVLRDNVIAGNEDLDVWCLP